MVEIFAGSIIDKSALGGSAGATSHHSEVLIRPFLHVSIVFVCVFLLIFVVWLVWILGQRFFPFDFNVLFSWKLDLSSKWLIGVFVV